MKRDAITKAETAALEFLEAVQDFYNRESSDEHFNKYNGICGFKETAALRRKSMDLTRALVGVRKP